jgi:hypothetical protein
VPSLRTVSQRFAATFETSAGFRFSATLSPAEEGSAPNDFSTPRVWLRVDPDLELNVGTEVQDPAGRWWLLADHEQSVVADQPIYRAFRAFRLTHSVSWTRAFTVTDILTGLPRSSGENTLGPLRCVMDPDRTYRDGVLRVTPNAIQLVTGRAVLLGDKIDNRVVKRINPVLGVYLAELE